MRQFFNTGTMVDSANADAPKGFRLVERWPELLIKLEQRTTRAARFRVTYGLQVEDELTYAEACKSLGKAMLHALACNDKLNNEGD